MASPLRAASHRVIELTACALVLALYYVGHERTFYWWDYALYHDIADAVAGAFSRSFVEGLKLVAERAALDHSALFALPLVPVLSIFGSSRAVFIGGLTALYLVPWALALGGLARCLLPAGGTTVFWTAAIVTLLTPTAWVPTLRGFPDAGAALLVALALRAQFSADRPMAAGALLGLAVLFRRHFLFALPAFAAAVMLSMLADRTPGPMQARLRALALRLLRLGAGLFLVLATVGLPFLRRLLTHDFYHLYAGYLNPAGTTALWFLQQYGWLFLAFAAAGYALAWWYGTLDPRWAFVCGVFFSTASLTWFLFVRQIGEPYTVHFTPVIVLGLTCLVHTAQPWLRLRAVRFCALAFGSALVWNLVLGLARIPIAYSPNPTRSLFAGNWSPLFRWDYLDLLWLERIITERTEASDPICVIASSPLLNSGVVRGLDRAFGGSGPPRTILSMPDVDSKDSYPLGALLQAHLVIVATPIQHHLALSEQQVVRAAFALFAGPSRFAQDFERLPETAVLEGGVTLSVFRRIRPTSPETALHTLREMQAAVIPTPGTQPAWQVIASDRPFWAYAHPGGLTEVIAHVDDGTQQPTLAVYLPAGAPQRRVWGEISFTDARCQGAALQLGGLDPSGGFRPVAEVVRHPGEQGRFQAAATLRPGEELALRLTVPDPERGREFCLLRLFPLSVGE